MSDIAMNTYEGVCQYCGNIQPVMALDQTDANTKISEECSCGGAELEKRKKRLLQNIRETVGKDAVNFGYSQASPEQEELIIGMALAALHGWIDSAVCKFGGTSVSIRGGEKVKVQRTDTKKSERTV